MSPRDDNCINGCDPGLMHQENRPLLTQAGNHSCNSLVARLEMDSRLRTAIKLMKQISRRLCLGPTNKRFGATPCWAKSQPTAINLMAVPRMCGGDKVSFGNLLFLH